MEGGLRGVIVLILCDFVDRICAYSIMTFMCKEFAENGGGDGERERYNR